jgi:hypothetical protein
MNAVTLGMLVAPVSVELFVERYWERLPLHVARDAPDYFADVYGVADIEESLVVGARELDRFALVRAGAEQAALDEYVVTRPSIRARSSGKAPVAHVDPRKVIGLFERGYTLVIKDAALASGRLQGWCNRLQRDLGAYVGANVYFTPPAAQGFDIHHDAHDTLTLQIEGRKTWRVYEPLVELPLESQPLHRDTTMPLPTLHREIALAAGDTLYLPRGYAHEAVAGSGRALHVTFALAPVRAIDLLHDALDVAAGADVALRRALPLGWQADPAFAGTFAAELAPRLRTIFAEHRVAEAARESLNELFAVSRGVAEAAFDRLDASAGLQPESLLRWNEDVPSLVRERETTVDVLLPGKALGLPKACLPALVRLTAGPVRYAELDLPFSDADRRRFVKSLVLEGLILVGDR